LGSKSNEENAVKLHSKDEKTISNEDWMVPRPFVPQGDTGKVNEKKVCPSFFNYVIESFLLLFIFCIMQFIFHFCGLYIIEHKYLFI